MIENELDEGRRQFFQWVASGAVVLATASLPAEKLLAAEAPLPMTERAEISPEEWYNKTNRRLLAIYATTVHMLLLEPADALSRLTIKKNLTNVLDKMVAEREIYKYGIVCDDSNNTPMRIDDGQILTTEVLVKPVRPNRSASIYRFPFQYVNPIVAPDGTIVRQGHINQDFT